MKLESALQSNRGKVVFAAIWAAILAALWQHVIAIADFHVRESNGKAFDWALALLFKTALSLAILTLLLWIGLAVYLALARQLKMRSLARGLAVMVFVLFVALGIESFVRTVHLSPVAEFVLRWLPMFASLFAGCHLAVPRKSGELFSRAAGKQ